jgi:hypothetical protein
MTNKNDSEDREDRKDRLSVDEGGPDEVRRDPRTRTR